MQIVIDGCDGVGKTTIAKHLTNKFNLGYLHFTQYDKSTIYFYKTMIQKKNYVYDRGAASELVYPTVFNRDKKIKQISFEHMVSSNPGVLFIFLYGNESSIVKNLKENEHKVIRMNIDYINSKFKTIYYELNHLPNVIGVDIDKFSTISQLVHYVERFVKEFYETN